LLSIGRRVSELALEPLFLIDDSLVYQVANALALFEYNVTSVRVVFGGRDRVKDPEIISWLAALDGPGVWIHADDRAKKQHRAEIIAGGISTVWVIRPGGSMSGKHQLRLLSWAIPNILDQYTPFHRPFHVRARERGESARPRPSVKPFSI